MVARRELLVGAGALGLAAAVPPPLDLRLPDWFDDLEQRTFAYFWELANPANGLIPDRWPTPSFASIAAVGFALTAYPIGAERGWVTRAQARERTLTTLRFFDRARQGPQPTGVTGHKGFFYHFLDMTTGSRYRQVELSSVDTAILHMGMLHAAAWFDGASPAERAIRDTAHRIVARADWPWFQNGAKTDAKNGGRVISMGWHPESGFLARGWTGYNEGMMVWLLALGSRGHPIADGGWSAWTETYPGCWRGEGATRRLAFAPLFGHQYSHVWVDFRGLYDAPMRAAGLDYFENSRRAAYANRAWCIANPSGWSGYSRDLWGLTACDGPGGTGRYHGYAARGPVGEPDGLDDGTLAPTAALGSLPFAPEICVPAADALRRYAGGRLYGRYGFHDSFNPSLRATGTPVETGSVDPQHGWVARDWLGIDQGPILAMLANHRSDSVWRAMRRSPVIRTGLRRAGFEGGWPEGI